MTTNAADEHPLQTAWACWYDKKSNSKANHEKYLANLRKVTTFDTVESFWRCYVHMKRPSTLENNLNVFVFRDGPVDSPSWESYPQGGCWILTIKKKAHSGASVLGKMWQDLILGLVGECFEEPTVVGVGMAVRQKADILSVWNSDNRNPDVRFAIGQKLKEILDLEPSCLIEYKHFHSSIADMSTYRSAKAYVFTPAAGATN